MNWLPRSIPVEAKHEKEVFYDVRITTIACLEPFQLPVYAPRWRWCRSATARFLGIELEEKRNAANEGVISRRPAGLSAVIRTDEETHDSQDGLPRSRPWLKKGN